MGWYAVDAVEEAIEDTKDILFPVSLKTWAKLGLIALLAGGSGFSIPNFPSSSNFSGDSIDSSDHISDHDIGPSPTPDMATGSFNSSFGLSGFAIIAGLVTGIILVFMYISSVFEFIYYQSLIDRDVVIRSNFRDNLNNGASYFLFKAGISLLTITAIIGAITVISSNILLLIPVILLATPFFMIISAFGTLIHDIVLVDMLEGNKGLISSAKSMFSVLRTQWKQTFVYLLLKMVIGIVVGVLALIVSFIISIVLIIPGIIIGIPAFALSPILGALIVIIGLALLLSLLAIFVLAPLKTFVYFYALNAYRKFKS